MKIQSYPSDLSQEEWDFVAPYLTLMKEDAPQREHSLREVFNALRCAGWRVLARRGGCCHMTSRPGRLYISSFGAGARRAALRRW